MLELVVDNRSGQELPLARLAALADFVFVRERAQAHREKVAESPTFELSLSFVDVDEITQLNATYRACAKPTDVLSFELDDPWDTALTPDAGRVLIGDIVIQPDIARQRAAAEEVSFEEELWILLIHGLLHLLGYDHVIEPDAARMEEREDEHLLQWQAHVADEGGR
jgi:probable rRNA maturation factor